MAAVREVVVVDAVRSAIGKSGRDGMKKNGQLCQASSQELLAHILRGLVDRVKARSGTFEEELIEDVIVGCLSQVGDQGLNIARVASLLAGIPNTASACTVNQFCNAGLKGIMLGAQSIMVGNGDVMICGGVEIMSHYGMGSDFQVAVDADYPVRFTQRFQEIGMHVPQGVCAEMISKDEGHTPRRTRRLWCAQHAQTPSRPSVRAGSTTSFPYTYEYNGENPHRGEGRDPPRKGGG